MDLRDATSYLLRAPDIGNWIKLADMYIQSYNRMPQGFVLPVAHNVLQPVIEAFAADATAFADYIRALRDSVEGVAYDELHALYRTISVRALQVVRRTRVRKAVLLLLPELEIMAKRSIAYDEQISIGKALEQTWGAARLSLMSRERNALTAKRLPTDERAAVLNAYWVDIDKQLTKGIVPLGDTTMDDLLGAIT